MDLRQDAHGRTDDRARSWELVNIAATVYDLAELDRRLAQVLGDGRPEEIEAAVQRDPSLMPQVNALANELHPRAWLRASDAPDLDALDLPGADVVRAAADGLAEGSQDVVLVQLAARLLSRVEGFPALAIGLKSNPTAVARWGDVTVADLLRCFQDRGGARPSPATIYAAANVGPMMRWAALSPRELSRVAWALRGMR